MKFSAVAAVSSLLTLAATKPLGGKHHHNHKRAVVWETTTAEVIEIEYATKTVWVEAPTTTPAASSPEDNPAPVYTPKAHTKKAAKKKSTTPAATQEPSSNSTPFVPPPPAPTTTEAPAQSATTEAPPPSPTTTEAPAPPAVTEAPPPPPPTTTEPPAPPPSSEAPPPPPPPPPPKTSSPASYNPPPSSNGGGSSSGSCGEVGGACSGDGTFYDVLKENFGSCGFNNDGLSEDVIALPHAMMGEISNGNPFCGRKVSITANGKTVTATAVDKCMGCDGQSIDLSHHCFDQLADESVGRIHVNWHFIT